MNMRSFGSLMEFDQISVPLSDALTQRRLNVLLEVRFNSTGLAVFHQQNIAITGSL
jgi:hypothetical protein